MKILFWGTPAFAIPSFRALGKRGFEIVGVVTRPDQPAGRGRRPRASAIKQIAEEMGVRLLTPDQPKGDGFLIEARRLEPDFSVVVAYGHILAQDVLDLPRLGSLNVHASLLPKLRGAAPINWAIARGHKETGISVQRMVPAMDAGPIIHQVREPILPNQTASELYIRLSELGAEALVEALTLLSNGEVEELEQDHDAATFAPKVNRTTARIDWNQTAAEVARHVRGMDQVPGAWSTLNQEPVKLFRPTVIECRGEEMSLASGLIVRVDRATGVVVSTGEGCVQFSEVQPSGRRRMRATDWIGGRKVQPGELFE
tara:strand:- start:2827 stop:3768 length:942 start_codon:yes stop_codon:yes gene_type:complete